MGMYNDKPITDFGLGNFDATRTKQAFKDEADINKIIKNFEKTGMVENLNSKTPFYGDVTEIKDYKEAINVVIEAEKLFMEMSPDIRERFSNDPARMIDFLSDKKNLKEAIDLGMVIPTPEKPKEGLQAQVDGGTPSK